MALETKSSTATGWACPDCGAEHGWHRSGCPSFKFPDCARCGQPITGELIITDKMFLHPATEFDCPAVRDKQEANRRRFAGECFAAKLQSPDTTHGQLADRLKTVLADDACWSVHAFNLSHSPNYDAMAAAAIGVFVDWLRNPPTLVNQTNVDGTRTTEIRP